MKRNQATALFLAAILFCCGVATGVLAHRYYAMSVVSARNAEDFRQRYISEMRSTVHLTPAQVTQLEAILDQTKAKYKAIKDTYRPAILEIKRQQINQVKSILRPDQIPLYDRLVAERERRMAEQEAREAREERRRTLHTGASSR